MAENSINNEAPFCIETPRLVIAEFTPEMAEDVHLNSLDGDNRRFVPDEVFETVEDARETVEFLISRYGGTEGPFVYPVLTKTGENIGYVQLVPYTEGWEIGYHIAKKFTGRGYASEAVSAFLPVMAETHGLTEIYGVCLAENAASARVMEKCGFTTLFCGVGPYQGQDREIVKTVWRAPAGKDENTMEENEKTMEDVLFESRYANDDAFLYETSRALVLHRPQVIVLMVLYVLFGIFDVWCIFWFLKHTGSVPASVWAGLAMVVLLPVVYLWSYRRVLKTKVRQLNELYGDRRPESTVSVTQNAVRYIDSTRVEAVELPLGSVKKTYETKNTLMLYTRSKMVFTFHKSGFIKGTPEEFKHFLKEKGIK